MDDEGGEGDDNKDEIEAREKQKRHNFIMNEFKKRKKPQVQPEKKKMSFMCIISHIYSLLSVIFIVTATVKLQNTSPKSEERYMPLQVRLRLIR